MKRRNNSPGEDEARKRIGWGNNVAFVVRKGVLVVDIDEKTSQRS